MAAQFTPGPWECVPGTEHHGPYVTSEFGNTICDLYTMTLPYKASTAAGGQSKPVPFLAEMADPNAHLIAASPDLYAVLDAILRHGELGCVDRGMSYPPGGKKPATQDVWQFPRHMLPDIEAALAKARGETP